MKQYIFGAVVLAIGITMVLRTDSYLRMFGQIDWFELHLSGGSRSGYKIIGVIVILIGFLAVTGQFSSFAGGIMTRLFVH